MSDTPRTDKLIQDEPWSQPDKWVTALDALTELSRTLEREITSLQQQLASLETYHKAAMQSCDRKLEDYAEQLAAKSAEAARIRKAALREAAATCGRIASNSKDFDAGYRRGAGACDAAIIALTTAEGGKSDG